mmetsp:Transcript_3950/g.8619  ORF Transcript_3950/g.8619 Transcript_3950/m.8619 type:complete len:295 (-) Transcript_3950:1409-2293(-)|eukprot:CAMPEP_0201189930 /NCGR_PEP_ID=MMETSP0851-20130426/138941_1 /ASSEMBLY_ACC=CAM_ASM_000631 /TAXON_ID=183588 /ORGANISM="Pseudo-nitzschia fraudulenta, Strain WWA7" /LENGTH=294 /DNA_ID=CAMNT_0047475857 /DNA_START=148 /DNA_END=1032 /DNA_ORIENTATION=+
MIGTSGKHAGNTSSFVFGAIFVLFTAASRHTCSAFEIGKIFSKFGSSASALSIPGADRTNGINSPLVQTAKRELLETISNTENGKESPLETQIRVLGLVDYLETKAPVSKTLLTDPSESDLVDGTWFLQYTQPSEPEGVDMENDIQPWTPEESSLDVTKQLDTRKANNEGAVSFLGVVRVDTSNKLTTQTIGVEEKIFANAVEQDFGTIQVKGFFEFDSVPNRIIASFDNGTLTLKNGFVIDFSFLFALRATLKGGVKAGGWLETTYVDDEIRIGRGNRGSLFVLSRDKDTVTP